MQIIKEGDQWLANQKTCADYFGVSIVAFQNWNYESVRTQGTAKLYDVRAIQNDLDAGQEEARELLDLTAERARLAKEQADKTEMENRIRRGELVETDFVIKVIGTAITSAKTRLLAIPSQLSRYLEHQTSQIIEAQLHDAIYEATAELSETPFGDVETPKKANGKSMGGRRKKAKRGGKRASGQMAH